MRISLIMSVVAASLVAGPSSAQTPGRTPDAVEAEVLQVVERVFEGMRTGDTTLMRSTFHPDVRLVTTGERDGQPVARVVPVSAWLESVAGADQVLDERLYDPMVHVSGNLATVWTYYTLHVGDTFSHCGYDAFQLVRTSEGWRIIGLADTRQRDGCRHTDPSP